MVRQAVLTTLRMSNLGLQAIIFGMDGCTFRCGFWRQRAHAGDGGTAELNDRGLSDLHESVLVRVKDLKRLASGSDAHQTAGVHGNNDRRAGDAFLAQLAFVEVAGDDQIER